MKGKHECYPDAPITSVPDVKSSWGSVQKCPVPLSPHETLQASRCREETWRAGTFSPAGTLDRPTSAFLHPRGSTAGYRQGTPATTAGSRAGAGNGRAPAPATSPGPRHQLPRGLLGLHAEGGAAAGLLCPGVEVGADGQLRGRAPGPAGEQGGPGDGLHRRVSEGLRPAAWKLALTLCPLFPSRTPHVRGQDPRVWPAAPRTTLALVSISWPPALPPNSSPVPQAATGSTYSLGRLEAPKVPKVPVHSLLEVSPSPVGTQKLSLSSRT